MTLDARIEQRINGTVARAKAYMKLIQAGFYSKGIFLKLYTSAMINSYDILKNEQERAHEQERAQNRNQNRNRNRNGNRNGNGNVQNANQQNNGNNNQLVIQNNNQANDGNEDDGRGSMSLSSNVEEEVEERSNFDQNRKLSELEVSLLDQIVTNFPGCRRPKPIGQGEAIGVTNDQVREFLRNSRTFYTAPHVLIAFKLTNEDNQKIPTVVGFVCFSTMSIKRAVTNDCVEALNDYLVTEEADPELLNIRFRRGHDWAKVQLSLESVDDDNILKDLVSRGKVLEINYMCANEKIGDFSIGKFLIYFVQAFACSKQQSRRQKYHYMVAEPTIFATTLTRDTKTKIINIFRHRRTIRRQYHVELYQGVSNKYYVMYSANLIKFYKEKLGFKEDYEASIEKNNSTYPFPSTTLTRSQIIPNPNIVGINADAHEQAEEYQAQRRRAQNPNGNEQEENRRAAIILNRQLQYPENVRQIPARLRFLAKKLNSEEPSIIFSPQEVQDIEKVMGKGYARICKLNRNLKGLNPCL